MKVSAKIKLNPTPEQHALLLKTLESANDACNRINEIVWQAQQFRRYTIQNLTYKQIRDYTGLTAQMVIRCIAKVADAYAKDKKTKRTFKEHGAIGYDDRILLYRIDKQYVSIWTVDGRQKIPYLTGEHQQNLLLYRRGESDLVYSKGKNAFFLVPVCDIPDEAEKDIDDWLGVDLGQAVIAATSDGDMHTNAIIESNRARQQTLRSNLQSVGTKSSKKHLKRLAGKQRRFQRDVNHVLSKRLVLNAERTKRGIALEDLTHIQARTRVKGKENRAKRSNWAFRQLRDFIDYKAQMHKVLVALVNPAYTSQRCFVCGHIEKANRKSQAEFCCKACGHTANADVNAAKNIARLGSLSRAAVSQPIVSDFSPLPRKEEKVLRTSPCL